MGGGEEAFVSYIVENNSCILKPSEPVIEEITFYIDNLSTTAMTNYTWTDWCNSNEADTFWYSDIDPSGKLHISDNYVTTIYEIYDDALWRTENGIVYLLKDGQRVKGTDIIVANYNYEVEYVKW